MNQCDETPILLSTSSGNFERISPMSRGLIRWTASEGDDLLFTACYYAGIEGRRGEATIVARAL